MSGVPPELHAMWRELADIGISPAPAESAAPDDCLAGVRALADVREGLACN